jgi:hypothetical protein
MPRSFPLRAPDSFGGSPPSFKPSEPPKIIPAEPSKIIVKEQTMGKATRHEDKWSRTPNATGTGAIHVRTFHSRLSTESVEYLDVQINEWLDAHPQYEVKFVTTAIGDWQGKLKEPNLIVQVWV